MALALISPMATLSLQCGRISAAAIGGGLRPRKAGPMGASATPFLRSSFVSSSSTSSASASPAALSAAVSASLTFTSASSFAGSSLGIEFSYNRADEDYRRKKGPEAQTCQRKKGSLHKDELPHWEETNALIARHFEALFITVVRAKNGSYPELNLE
ncbi:hypothetical protein E2562_030927 [Oryza meyeriana var. granulata]|uniref:Uncharacterized protein n=1 Tax=Oryza meyeriana var. granulata TaxID=110450 RepID=A0A6G1E548_9ORYZ|nr:hypothetical protein E2562_030927 [Oryza meyeriana var. granulata]